MTKTASLRKFPYPFQAALAISNDNHANLALQDFIDVHCLLNSEENTPYGRGLGLEIADSFWFFSANPNRAATYYKALSTEPSEFAPLIRRLIRAGCIDTLHTYGDFSLPGVFRREFARQAVQEMREQDLDIPVWVNHGNKHNVQNVNRGIGHHQGAKTESEAYHSDLTIQAGFKFFWNSQLTRVVGQGRRPTLNEFVNIDFKRPLTTGVRIARAYARPNTLRCANKLLVPLTLNDGRRIYTFPRFNNHENIWRGVSSEDLHRQLSKQVLDELVARQGYMIVYNHLFDHLPFEADAMMALQNLSREFKAGRILVATTARLLWYCLVHASVRWDEEWANGEKLIIRIRPHLEDEVLGKIQLHEKDLMGLTFYVARPETVSIFLEEKPIENVSKTSPDETRRSSVSIPWRPLRCTPELYH